MIMDNTRNERHGRGKGKAFTVAALLFGCLLTGCIKENRTDCPCYLYLSFPNRELAGKHLVNIAGYDPAQMFLESIKLEDYPDMWYRAVPKGTFYATAHTGTGFADETARYITIPIGHQCDSLYAWYKEVECLGDETYEDVIFHKQFATVFFDIRTLKTEASRFRLQVNGFTHGFDVVGFAPLDGSFRFETTALTGEHIVPFRIPRQKDGSMYVNITMDGAGEMRFPLGQYVLDSGYNWGLEDLEDIYFSVDLVASTVTVRVAGWEYGKTFRIIEQ